AMEDLYRKESMEIASQPMRTLNRLDEDSIILTMPSYSRRLKRFAVKIVSEYRNNPKNFSLPVQGGVIVLIDANNSQALAILESATLTATRTGAVSGLATRLLSREDSNSVAVVGSGQQARAQLEAVCLVRKIYDARVFSRDFSHAERFAAEMSSNLGVTCVPHSERRTALRGADIIILATNSSEPVLEWGEVSRGAHINSIGTLPERRELDLDTVCKSRLYVDAREGVLKEAGDVIHAISSGRITENHILGDLGELLSGKSKGRQDRKDVTLFKSVGFAMQDVYASDRVFETISRDGALVGKISVPELRSP
ncbi:MAG: ornithine cyclodeaminase family protein, partial [Nitrososphaerales archaeon]